MVIDAKHQKYKILAVHSHTNTRTSTALVVDRGQRGRDALSLSRCVIITITRSASTVTMYLCALCSRTERDRTAEYGIELRTKGV